MSRPSHTTPASPMALVLNSFGLTTAPDIGPTAAEVRLKSETEEAEARRLALPLTVKTWTDRLSFAEMEALAAVQRLYDANNRVSVVIPRADLAAHLRTTPEQAEALLNRLAAAGAITRNHQLQGQPRYAPVAAPPAPKRSQKGAAPAIAWPDPSALPRFRSALGLRNQ